MKANTTMYRIAKAKAIEIGPRPLQGSEKTLVGFYLTHEELRKIHALEGFNTHGSAWERRVKDWDDFGEIIRFKDNVVFTFYDTTKRLAAEKVALECNASEIII